MIYYFLLIGYYRLFLHKYRRHIFHQKVSAGYQPYIENRGKDKGLCSGLPEFIDTGFRTQGSHGHCQQESIYIVDKGSQALCLLHNLPQGRIFFRTVSIKLLKLSFVGYSDKKNLSEKFWSS